MYRFSDGRYGLFARDCVCDDVVIGGNAMDTYNGVRAELETGRKAGEFAEVVVDRFSRQGRVLDDRVVDVDVEEAVAYVTFEVVEGVADGVRSCGLPAMRSGSNEHHGSPCGTTGFGVKAYACVLHLRPA